MPVMVMGVATAAMAATGMAVMVMVVMAAMAVVMVAVMAVTVVAVTATGAVTVLVMAMGRVRTRSTLESPRETAIRLQLILVIRSWARYLFSNGTRSAPVMNSLRRWLKPASRAKGLLMPIR